MKCRQSKSLSIFIPLYTTDKLKMECSSEKNRVDYLGGSEMGPTYLGHYFHFRD